MMKKHPHYPDAPTFTVTRPADTHLHPLLAATVEATEEKPSSTRWWRQPRWWVGMGVAVEAISIPTLQRILKDRGFPRIEYGAGF